MTATSSSPPWLLDGQILVAQLASGIAEFAEQVDSGAPFRLPYPVNLQAAFDQLTLLAWHQGVAPPGSVVELLQLAEVPFGEWAIALPDAYVDPEESLLVHGRLGTICEELGSLRGDVAGEMRENFLIRVVIDKCRAADAPDSYVAFRQLLIERPAITALDLDTALTRPELAPLSDELRSAYVPAPPEAISDGVDLDRGEGLTRTVQAAMEHRVAHIEERLGRANHPTITLVEIAHPDSYQYARRGDDPRSSPLAWCFAVAA